MHMEANRRMSVRKDSYAWLWVALAVVGIVVTIVVVVISMAQPRLTLHVGDGVFTARVAKTDSQRAKGLSGVNNLPKHQAMLFIFPKSEPHGIWMKDMRIPIDVVWLDESKKVIHIVRDMDPTSYPTIYRPQAPARYVVELPAGTVKERAIRLGTIARFDENAVSGAWSW